MTNHLKDAAQLIAFAAVAVLMSTGCAVEAQGPTAADMPSTEAQAECVDEDGDGFGAGCEAGWDCDDADADAAESCEQTETACEDGAVVDCTVKLPGSEHSENCFVGVQMCNGGEWTPCSEAFDI